MPHSVDYYMVPNSPWTYLGHQRLMDMVAMHGATVRVLPFDLGAVFKVSGGLPLGQRPAQRRAYRLVELKRFSEHLRLPMQIEPRYFPVAGDLAAKLIVAVEMHDGSAAALTLGGAALKAVWEQQRDLADPATLAALLSESGLAAVRLEEAQTSQPVADRYAANTQAAIELGVFGAPTYLVDGEMFWGQDRLDFVRARLAA